MNAVNSLLFALGVPLWFWAAVWGGLTLLVTVPSILGGLVGLSWPTTARAGRDGGDTFGIPPRAIGRLVVWALMISVLLIPLASLLFGATLSGIALGGGVMGFVLNVLVARASVPGRETAAWQQGEQTASGDEAVRNDSNE